MPYLRVINEHGQTTIKSYPVTKEITIIGRSNHAEVFIQGDGVSRQHAQIRKSGALFLTSDMGSRNGTYLNNHLLDKETVISVGDHLRIGQTILMFMDESTEPGVVSMVVGEDDSEFQGTMYKADQLAVTMVAGEATPSDDEAQDYLRFLTQLSKDVLAITNEHELSEMLTQRLMKWFDVDCCAVVYAQATDEGYDLDTRSISWADVESSRGITISRTAVNQALDNRMASITTNAMQDDRFAEQQSVIARGITSILCVPLWHEEQIFGLVYMDTANPARQLDLDHLRLLSAIANLAAIKIDQVRLFAEVLDKVEMEKELELAGEIQSSLLPGEHYTYNNLVCVGSHEACKEVGGDYYDFVPFSDKILAVTIADVTGHGPSSAFLMVACKSMLIALIEAGIPFDVRIDRLNRYLVKHCQPTQFITFFHAEIDSDEQTIRYCNAGHNPPILIPETEDIHTLEPKGPPLGIMEMPYAIDSAAFVASTKLVMYTDGITEASNPTGELYEDHRLMELVTLQRKSPAEDLKGTILSSVSKFADGTEHLDDVTLSIVEST